MGTTPQQISEALNHIASKIDHSENPSASAVKRDLNLVIASITHRDKCRRIAREIVKLALVETAAIPEGGLDPSNQKLADILWMHAGKDVDASYSAAHQQTNEETLTKALSSLKRDIDDFIKELAGEETSRQKLREEIKKEEEEGDVVTSAPPVK